MVEIENERICPVCHHVVRYCTCPEETPRKGES